MPPKSKNKLIKKSDIDRQYQKHPSIADYLPWLEWSDQNHIMLLEDGRSVGALLELRDMACEAKPMTFIERLHQDIMLALSSVVPLEDDNPWVIQFFIQDDVSLEGLYQRLTHYIDSFDLLSDSFSQHYLAVIKKHFALLSREQGLFTDPLSGLPFRGKTRRIRLAVYRRYHTVPKNWNIDVVAELEHTLIRLSSRLQQIGISVRRMQGKHCYDWWVRWFNPHPTQTQGNVDELLKRSPYPSSQEKTLGWSFSQNIFFGSVESTDTAWKFDDVFHKTLVFKELHAQVDIGVISREREFGERQKYALLDKCPPGTIYTLQIVFESKKKLTAHLDRLEKAAVGKSLVVKDILTNLARAHHELEQGNLLFRTAQALYFRAPTLEALNTLEVNITSLLNHSGLEVLATSQELYPLDTYLRFLPFNFNESFDRKYTARSTYQFSDDVARLLPLYGRSRGDGLHPLHIYFNRGGEGFIFDHLHSGFKSANSHMAIVGSTGAGKSALINYLCLSLMAVRNPRIIVIEAGGSFDLLAKYLAHHGKKVSTLKFERKKPIAINPYSEAYTALKMVEQEEALLAQQSIGKSFTEKEILETFLEEKVNQQAKTINSQKETASEIEIICDEDRDILSEMALATRTMITGGDEREEALFSRSDMMLVNQVLIHTMKTCASHQVPQMLAQHVIAGCLELAVQETNTQLQARLKQFALSMQDYQTGLKARFINRPSPPLVVDDFLQVELGFLQEDKYRDFLNVIFISLLAKILALAEANKAEGRPTILFMDEAHILFKSPMVASFITLMAKVARKIGLWLIPCTQNLNDFSSIESRKVLSLMETWLCLAIDKEEVNLIHQFKPLTDETRAMILDIRKYPKIYSEAVLLGKNFQGLFRIAPPRIALSLGMTEQEERTELKRLQEKHHCSELEAVEIRAKLLEQLSHTKGEDHVFDD